MTRTWEGVRIPAGAVVFEMEVPRQYWMNANHRSHWAKRARFTGYVRHLAAVHAREQELPKRLDPARVVAYICAPTARSEDPNNANPTTKAMIDGLTDYGCWPDDAPAFVEGPHHLAGPVTPGRRVVRLVITRREQQS